MMKKHNEAFDCLEKNNYFKDSKILRLKRVMKKNTEVV